MNANRALVRQFELGPMANYIYLIGCLETHEGAVVDPAWNVEEILQLAGESGLVLRHVLLTHGHPDHMNGLEGILEATDAKVWIHRDESYYMRQAASFFGIDLDFMARRSANFRTISDGAEIEVGRLRVKAIHTPGHTPGSQCFLVDGNLISGDTLFIGACGRFDLPGGDPEKLWSSLNHRLATLDNDTIVYPGHNYSTSNTSTIGHEKLKNPYFQFADARSFLDGMQGF